MRTWLLPLAAVWLMAAPASAQQGKGKRFVPLHMKDSGTRTGVFKQPCRVSFHAFNCAAGALR